MLLSLLVEPGLKLHTLIIRAISFKEMMFNSFRSTFGLKFHSSQNINYFGIKCTYDIFVLAVLINYISISAVVKMLALSNELKIRSAFF